MIIQPPYHYLGFLLIILGLLLNYWAYQFFREKQTTIKPLAQPSSLITEGPFHWTRNPMALGLIIILLGVALLLNQTAALLMPLAGMLALQTFFIPAEEKILRKTFGQKYSDYQKRVRRWF